MRKIILATLLTLTVGSVFAHQHGYWRPHHQGGGWNWVVPAVVGGVVVYEATRPPVYVQPQPPVIVQQPQPVVVQGQNCSPWTQIQNPDGSITTTRTCQ